MKAQTRGYAGPGGGFYSEGESESRSATKLEEAPQASEEARASLSSGSQWPCGVGSVTTPTKPQFYSPVE